MDAVTLALAKAYTNSQRNGYVEYRDIVCFPEAEFEFIGAVNLNIPGNPFGDGDTVTVVYDGVEYVRTAKLFPEEYNGLASGYYVGNLKFVGGEDTGEPFALLSGFDRSYSNFLGFIVVDTDNFVDLGGEEYSTHRIGCKTVAETIHPIDPKFLPGAVLPVVELSTVPSTEGSPLTEAETAAIVEMAQNSTPIVLKFHDSDGAYYGVVCSYLGGGYIYGDGLFSVVAQDFGEGLGWRVAFTMLG